MIRFPSLMVPLVLAGLSLGGCRSNSCTNRAAATPPKPVPVIRVPVVQVHDTRATTTTQTVRPPQLYFDVLGANNPFLRESEMRTYDWGPLHGHNGVDIANAMGTSFQCDALGACAIPDGPKITAYDQGVSGDTRWAVVSFNMPPPKPLPPPRHITGVEIEKELTRLLDARRDRLTQEYATLGTKVSYPQIGTVGSDGRFYPASVGPIILDAAIISGPSDFFPPEPIETIEIPPGFWRAATALLLGTNSEGKPRLAKLIRAKRNSEGALVRVDLFEGDGYPTLRSIDDHHPFFRQYAQYVGEATRATVTYDENGNPTQILLFRE